MNRLSIITTPEQHAESIARLSKLMDLDPAPGSADADELDVLALLIERYEQEHFPIDSPDPVDAIRFRMDQQGLRNKDLIPMIGSASKVSEVLNRKRALSLNMIRKISEALAVPAEVLIRDPTKKNLETEEIEWTSFPLAEMRKRGYFEGFSGSLQELREYAAERVGSFLGSVPNGFSLRPSMLRTTAHVRTNNKKTDPYSLWAWQIRVLQRARKQRSSGLYHKGTVNPAWLRTLAQLSWSEKGPQLALEYVRRSGIIVVVEPHLPKTYLDGAVRLDDTGTPVIGLTLRYDRIDHFWFTLTHELAHIALHLDQSDDWFVDDIDAECSNELEEEADSVTANALIPSEVWEKGHPVLAKEVETLARELNITPCIIAGRLRHDNKDHKLFGPRFRDTVDRTALV